VTGVVLVALTPMLLLVAQLVSRRLRLVASQPWHVVGTVEVAPAFVRRLP